MKVLGLTGSIGMGKSTAARQLRRMGLWVHDADAAVHRLMGKGGQAVARIGATFPGVVVDGAVDRTALGARVFDDRLALRALEAILHPMVRAEERAFLARARRARRRAVVLDIPLLFETAGEQRCDAVLVVSCPRFLQAQRVMKRPGMTHGRLRAVLAKQMPDHEKRKRADAVIPTGLGLRPALRHLRRAVTLLTGLSGAGLSGN